MSKNYEDYKPINPQPPRKRKNPALSFVKYAICFLMIISVAVAALFFVSTHSSEMGGGPQKKPIIETSPVTDEQTEPSTDDVTTDSPVPDENAINLDLYTSQPIEKAAINTGNLIFVSNNYNVVYPNSADLVKISAQKTKSYSLSSNSMLIHKDVMIPINQMFDAFADATGHKDVMIQTAYRDEARQQKVYDDYVAKNGEEAAKGVVVKAGESDHHTALGIALKVFKDGKSYQFNEVEGYEWILENCYKYGFVERYPTSKKEITGLDYSSSLYLRYVGVPVAEFMKKNDICLEEFIIKIKDYVFGQEHLEFVSEYGVAYEFYYVDGETDGEMVGVPVPNDKEYTISGNNMDGFIVIAKK